MYTWDLCIYAMDTYTFILGKFDPRNRRFILGKSSPNIWPNYSDSEKL